MLGSSPFPLTDEEKTALDKERFLTSHRAHAACTREFGRLSDEVARLAGELHGEILDGEADVRMTPGRCIVQLGPVALTLAWLRSTLDSVAEGKLLVIAWRGTIAPGGKQIPERGLGPRSPRTAVALWEETLVADGTSEESWEWRSESDATRAWDSAALASRCVERLRSALAESRG